MQYISRCVKHLTEYMHFYRISQFTIASVWVLAALQYFNSLYPLRPLNEHLTIKGLFLVTNITLSFIYGMLYSWEISIQFHME